MPSGEVEGPAKAARMIGLPDGKLVPLGFPTLPCKTRPWKTLSRPSVTRTLA